MPSPDPGGTGCSGGAALACDGRYDRNLRIAASASSSVSTTRSAKPVVSACRRQPPSSCGSTCSPIASEASSELDTASTAPLRITHKSDSTAYQLDEP